MVCSSAPSIEAYETFEKIQMMRAYVLLLRILVKISSDAGALHYSIIVAATWPDLAPRFFVAPYPGFVMEGVFRENGSHALIIHDK